MNGFTEIPPDKPYLGMTRYTAPDGRAFACMGVGKDRRKALVERAEKKE